MSWLGISDGRRAWRLPHADTAGTPALLTLGSLVIETTFSAKVGLPQVVVHMDRTDGWHRSFKVMIHASGEVLVEHRQNLETTYASLQLRKPDQDDILRLTYAWDAPGRQGLLAVENLETGGLDQAAFKNPQPWPIDDITALIHGQSDCSICTGVSLLACSDMIEQIGMPLGIVADAVVETATGPRQAQDLTPGDLVQTADSGMQPVRWIVSRERPCFGSFAPICLRAPFFGLDRNLSLSQEHRMLIKGSDAEYLFGADAVLVEARHLTRMADNVRQTASATVTYVQIILDSHECIAVSGAWAESLYLGNMGRGPSCLAAAILEEVPVHCLPVHTQIANPQLKSYEAMVLMSSLIA